jgi:hypothetical protein
MGFTSYRLLGAGKMLGKLSYAKAIPIVLEEF